MSITHNSSIRHLNRFAVVMRLDEFAPVGGRATSGRHRWWFERFAEMCQDLPDRSGLGDERDQPDVATAVRALEGKLLSHPGHEFRPGNPGGVVRAGFLMRVRAASRGVTVVSMSPGRDLALLADVCDRERGDGGPELVVRRKHPVIPASWATQAGAPLPAVGRLIGDRSINATAVYARADTASARAVADIIDRRLREARGMQS